jgi:phage baseplate assembly protein W
MIMQRESGAYLTDELEHIRQSVLKIVTTPIGSRVMRREYGSLIPELIDSPINARVRLLIMAAIVTAVIKWEPRLRPIKVALSLGDTPGAALTVELSAALKSGHNAGQTLTFLFGV